MSTIQRFARLGVERLDLERRQAGRVVDQDVNAAPFLAHKPDRTVNLRCVTDVHRVGEGFAARGGDLLGGALCPFLVDVKDGNPGTMVSEGLCHLAADASSGAGKNDPLPLQAEPRHGLPPVV